MLRILQDTLIYSPLEQFEILSFTGFITNSAIFLVLPIIFILGIYELVFIKSLFLLKETEKWGHFFEILHEQLIILIVQNLGVKVGQIYFSWLVVFFLVISCWNLIGIVPYAFTVTSHIIITLALSTFFFGGINVRAILANPIKFLGLFLPSNVPLGIVPFLVLIEIVSYIARLFSLAIRLFANIIAGHTLLKILISFTFVIIFEISKVNWLFLPLSLLPFLVVVLITFLEVAIAILQAYVFLVLLCLYIKDFYVNH